MREEEPISNREADQTDQNAEASAPANEAAESGAGTDEQQGGGGDTMRVFEEDVMEALRNVYDPEIPINVYELGLIYNVEVSEANDVKVEMTLTTPNCPEAQNIPPKAKGMIKKMVPGVNEVNVELVWEPPWTMEMMSEDAKLALGLF